jgi:hypothetical protein
MSRKLEIQVMSDQEFYAMKEKQKREACLTELLKAASTKPASRSGFSVKDIKGKPEKPKQQVPFRTSSDGITLPIMKLTDGETTSLSLSDTDWDELMRRSDELSLPASPIDVVTDYSMTEFGKRALEDLGGVEEDPDKRYSAMFKKETAMLAEVLKDVKKQTKRVNDKLDSIHAKGSSGVYKIYPDLVNASNSLASTTLNIIKTMSDLKSKSEDFRLKSAKLNPVAERTTDELVDEYYKSLMNGNRSEFIDKARMVYSPLPEDKLLYDQVVTDGYTDVDNNGVSTRTKIGFNITQPIPEEYNERNGYIEGDEYDSHGYIKNEHRKVDVCVQRFVDGRLSFVALGDDGIEVDGYELPSDELLSSIDINPMSVYCYDKYGRKYRIVDIDTDGVDLSDIDDENYQYDS